jgi:hypothetical protein
MLGVRWLGPWLSTLVLTLAGAGVARAEQADGAIILPNRQNFAFLLGTPTGEVARTSSSEVIRMFSEVLRKETDFNVQLLDAAVMIECRGKLGCISLKARARDYDPAARPSENGQVLPYREHVRRLKEEKVPYPRYLLVISNVTLEGEEDRMTAVLVDTDRALNLFHDASRKVSDWQDDVEARINSSAVLIPPIKVNVRDADETRSFLERLVVQDFRAFFESGGHWRPYGELVIEGPEPGLGVSIDGDTVGATQPGTTRILQMLPGTHRVELVHPDYAPFQQDVTVTAGAAARIDARPARLAGSAAGLHAVVFWGGIATAIAGAALVGVAVTNPSDVTTACFEAEDCQSNSAFLAFGHNDQSELARDVNPGSVLIAPLGYSLVGTGAAFSLGSLLTDENEIPWLPVVVGLGIGALSYGLSVALNGGGVP